MKQKWELAIWYGIVPLMQVCWLGTILDLLNQKVADGSLPTLAVLAFYPSAFGFQRLLSAWRRPRVVLPSCLVWAGAMLFLAKIQFFGSFSPGDARWLSSLWQAMGQMFHTFNPLGLMVISSAVLWGLGWRLAYVRIQFSTVLREFQFGLAIFLAAFFVQGQLGMKIPLFVPAALAFFFLSLAGISLSHSCEQTGWLSGPHRGFWFGFLLLSIGFILSLGLLISKGVTPSLISFILSLLAQAGQFLLDLAHKLLMLLSNLFPPPKPADLPPSLRMPQIKGPPEAPFVLFSDSVREVLRFIWSMGCLALLLAALWRICGQIFEWLRRKLGALEEAEVEPMPGAFGEDLLNWLRRIILAFGFRWPFGKGAKSPPSLSEAESVRRMYRQLLKWAAKRGCVRQASQTPMEYLQALLQWLPESRWDLTFITLHYVRARYGLWPPNQKDLEQLGRSWHQLKNRNKKNSENRR
jgi:hypothetical protein